MNQKKTVSNQELQQQIAQLQQDVFNLQGEKADLEILVEAITAHSTDLENQLYAKNEQMSLYLEQVEKVIAAAAAVENQTFQPESLSEVSSRHDELGRLARVFCQMVQNLKARERELATAKEQLEAVLDAVPGSISWIDSTGKYLGVNRHQAETLNLSPDAFIGQEIGFVRGSHNFAAFLRQFLASSDNLASQVVEMDIEEAKKYYLVAARKYQQGNATVSVGIDLERQLKRALLLEQITQKIRQSLDSDRIFQTTVRVIGTTFGTDRCQIINSTTDRPTVIAEYLKSGNNSILGQTINFPQLFDFNRSNTSLTEQIVAYADVYQENSLHSAVPLFQNLDIKSMMAVPIVCHSDSQHIIVLYQHIKADNRSHHWNQEEIELLQAVANQVEIAIQQATILEREKQNNQALAIAKKNAEIANRSKSEFLANMSHELRTPLNAILGFSQLMERDRNLSPQQLNSLGIINHSGEHLLNLLNDVLEMSKIEAGRTTVAKNAFDLLLLLQSLEEMFQIRATSKNIALEFNIAPDLPQYICSDEGKLRQILINLLGNGIKFTRIGGVVLTASQIESQSTEKFSQLIFTIQDTGRGIATTEKDKIFEPFVQTDLSDRTEDGTGLGLAISRQFARLLGGDIDFSSILNRGSTFTLKIAVETAAPSALKPPPEQRKVIGIAPQQPEYRILVVDDKEANRELLVKFLTTVGFPTRIATNGKEAIKIWQQWQPHLIWMDMRMPIMDGYEATKQIKAHQQENPTIIIALTATAFEEEKTKILAVGCDDVVRKPFKEAEIFNKMAELLSVKYIYATDETNLAPSSSNQNHLDPQNLNLSDLALMPLTWLAALRQAAIEVDAEEIMQLIRKISSDRENLIEALTELTSNYCFDEIISVVEKHL